MRHSGLARQIAVSADPRRPVLLVNPFARGARRDAVARVVERVGLDANAVLEVGRDGGVRELARRAARDGLRVLYAAGGDGTWHHAVQELAGTGTALGVIPMGTSNDLAHRLQVPRDLDQAVDVLAGGAIGAVDLIRMDQDYVATVGGFGVAAHVAAACNDLRARPLLGGAVRTLGRTIYPIVAAGRILWRGPEPALCMTRDGGSPPRNECLSAILVGTVGHFGGGLELAPVDPAPGTFTAMIITATSRASLLDTLLRMRTGRPLNHHARRLTGLRRLFVRFETFTGAFGDGEWLGLRHRVTVAVEPGALLAVVPRSSAPALVGSSDAVASNALVREVIGSC